MQYTVPTVINEVPSAKEWKAIYTDSKLRAKLAYKNAKWVYIRTRLSESQNWKCCWCGCHTTDSRGKKNSTTVEHIVPRSSGGTDEWENLAMACSACNSRRGSQSVQDFMEGVAIQRSKTARERQREKRERRYLKRADQFQKTGWIDENGNSIDFFNWLQSIRSISAECRKQLVSLYGGNNA
jgi:CRISPR/Cas system Type II protein with McrA/HNH and RuvC-like nuclease domain